MVGQLVATPETSLLISSTQHLKRDSKTIYMYNFKWKKAKSNMSPCPSNLCVFLFLPINLVFSTHAFLCRSTKNRTWRVPSLPSSVPTPQHDKGWFVKSPKTPTEKSHSSNLKIASSNLKIDSFNLKIDSFNPPKFHFIFKNNLPVWINCTSTNDIMTRWLSSLIL